MHSTRSLDLSMANDLSVEESASRQACVNQLSGLLGFYARGMMIFPQHGKW